VDPGGGDMKGAAEKLTAFWRFDKHMFAETPSDSMRGADSFDLLRASVSRSNGDL
jgi:hypothetical protein